MPKQPKTTEVEKKVVKTVEPPKSEKKKRRKKKKDGDLHLEYHIRKLQKANLPDYGISRKTMKLYNDLASILATNYAEAVGELARIGGRVTIKSKQARGGLYMILSENMVPIQDEYAKKAVVRYRAATEQQQSEKKK